MNVLHVTPYYAPAWAHGGVVRAVTDLTRAQARAGHQVVVLTTDTLDGRRRHPLSQEALDGVRVVRLRNRTLWPRRALNLSTPAGIGRTARSLLADHAIQLVHCHELRSLETLSVARQATRQGVPVVLSPHGTLSLETGRGQAKRLWDRAFARRLLPRFDHVIALTGAEAGEARALWSRWRVALDPARIAVVPNGVDPDSFAGLRSGTAFRARWNLGDGPVVLFLGRLAARKGIGILADAFLAASRDVPTARLLVVGPDDGGQRDLIDRACRAPGRVVLTGLLTGEDRLAAYAAADLFALPAIGEGFSVAVLEAMSSGLPVVLTPGCHFPEVEPAGAGLVVEREAGALAAGLRALLLDPARRRRMGACAQELVGREYTWSRVVNRLDAVYDLALARGRHDA